MLWFVSSTPVFASVQVMPCLRVYFGEKFDLPHKRQTTTNRCRRLAATLVVTVLPLPLPLLVLEGAAVVATAVVLEPAVAVVDMYTTLRPPLRPRAKIRAIWKAHVSSAAVLLQGLMLMQYGLAKTVL